MFARRGGGVRSIATLLVLLAFGAYFAIYFATSFEPMSASGAQRTVRVGLYENEPKVFTAGKLHEPSGIFVDLLTQIAKEEGWKLKWVPGTWDEGLAALEEGRIDLMPDVAYSTERDDKYDFHHTPVVNSWSNVYGSPGVRADSISELQGMRVAVLKGSIQETVFEQMVKGFGYHVTIVPVSSLKEAFRLASERKVDAAIANHLFGDYFFRKYGLVKTPIVFNAVPLYYATANGRNAELRLAIDRHLGDWIAEADSIYYRTLNRYMTSQSAGVVPSGVFWLVGIIGTLLVAATLVIWLLRWQVRLQTGHLKAAHAAVAEAEETLRLAIDAADEGIFEWYPKTGEVIWAPRNFVMLGFEPDEFEASFDKWVAMVHPDDRDRMVDEVTRSTRDERGSFWVEYRLQKKDGDWMWALGRGKTATVDADGHPERVVGTNLDITEQKRAEQEIRRLNSELEERVDQRTAQLQMANKDLESFTYTVSHDLRAPLRAISGFAQIVAQRHREDLNEEGRHYLDNIVRASEHMGHLIEDLLTYSRLGRQSVQLEPVSLSHLLGSVAADFETRFERAGGRLEIAKGLPMIHGDDTLLRQVFTNLIDNALTYRRVGEPPQVTIGWYDDGSDVVVTVRDNGIGIPQEHREKVFDIFQRLHGDDEYPGTGIGLANVRRCAQMLSGEVWLESVVNEGTTVFVRLPKER